MRLNDQLHGLSQGVATQLPEAVSSAFAAEQDVLDAAGLPAGIAVAGDPLPDADLLDAHGQPTTMDKARAGQRAVVVFYRGGWCPFCNLTLRTYQQELVPALAARGVELIAVSPQHPDGSLSMQETNELTFTVLSDPGNQLAGGLGVLTRPSDDTRAAQVTLGLDLTEVNADGTTTLPMPTVVVVATDGTIEWIDVHPNYVTRTEPEAILSVLDGS